MDWLSFVLGFLTAVLGIGAGVTVIAWRAFAAVERIAAGEVEETAPRGARAAEEVAAREREA